MFRIFALFVTLIILLGPSQAHASTKSKCPKGSTTKVKVNIINSGFRIDHSNNLKGILDIAQSRSNDIALGSNEIPVGLTSAALSIQTRYALKALSSSRTNLTCAYVTDMVVDLGYKDTTIFMPTELKPYTCGYTTVLGHEKRHVQMDSMFITKMQPHVYNALNKIFSTIGAIEATSLNEAKQKIQGIVDTKLNEMSASYSSDRRNWHKRVDTPEEYTRISRACGGNIRSIVKTAQQKK